MTEGWSHLKRGYFHTLLFEMADTDDLAQAFDAFCSFGAGSKTSSGSLNNMNSSTMDGAKWAKFCRDNDLIKGKVTSVEVDIVFNKVKGKTARKISFDEFQEALKQIAAIRYKSTDNLSEQYRKIVNHVIESSPKPLTKGTTV